MEASLATGLTSGAVVPVGSYGDRHALVRGSWGTGDGIQVDFLMVMVTNDAGQALHMGHYDPEDEERALEDVRRRFVAASDTR